MITIKHLKNTWQKARRNNRAIGLRYSNRHSNRHSNRYIRKTNNYSSNQIDNGRNKMVFFFDIQC